MALGSRRLYRHNATNYFPLLALAVLSPRKESQATTTCIIHSKTFPSPVVYSHWSCDLWCIVRTLASGREHLTFWHKSNGARRECRNRPGVSLSELFMRLLSTASTKNIGRNKQAPINCTVMFGPVCLSSKSMFRVRGKCSCL